MLVLIILLIAFKLPLENQPAAIIGFPVAMLSAATLILVLLVLVGPDVHINSEPAIKMHLDLICEPAVGIDPEDGRLLAMNELAVALFGPREELIGAQVEKLAGDTPSRSIEDEVLATTSPDYEDMGHFSVRLGTGETRQFPVVACRRDIADHDTVALVFRADEVDRALAGFSRMQERLMSNIGHELRTPLNVVMGFSELLAANTFGELEEKQLDGVAEIHTGGQRMLNIVDDVLDIGRARNYGKEVLAARLELGAMITRVRDLVKGTARREKVRLEFDTQDDLPVVNADERTFKQLVYHLLVGAVDRTNVGEVVELVATAGEDTVQVRVTSIGLALTPGDIAVLDDPPDRIPIGAEGLPTAMGMELCAGLATHLGVTISHSSSAESVTLSFSMPVA